MAVFTALPFGKAAPILIGLNGAANAGWETEQRGGTADQIVGKMVVSFLLDYGLSAFPIKIFSQALKAVPGGKEAALRILRSSTNGIMVGAVGNVATVATDEMIMGDASWVQTIAKELVRQGVAPELAETTARWKMYVYNTTEAALLGGVVGGLSASFGELVRTAGSYWRSKGESAATGMAPLQKNQPVYEQGTELDANGRLTQAQNGGIMKDNVNQNSGNKVTVNQGQQDKHIVGTNNYRQSEANGQKRSILEANPQDLLDDFAGSGIKIPGTNKERVDFGYVIGEYYDVIKAQYFPTTRGIIHYDTKGQAHIVPSAPS